MAQPEVIWEAAGVQLHLVHHPILCLQPSAQPRQGRDLVQPTVFSFDRCHAIDHVACEEKDESAINQSRELHRVLNI